MEFGTVWVTVVKVKELTTFQRCYISIYLLVISLQNVLQTPLLSVISTEHGWVSVHFAIYFSIMSSLQNIFPILFFIYKFIIQWDEKYFMPKTQKELKSVQLSLHLYLVTEFFKMVSILLKKLLLCLPLFALFLLHTDTNTSVNSDENVVDQVEEAFKSVTLELEDTIRQDEDLSILPPPPTSASSVDDLAVDWQYQLPAPPTAFRDTDSPTLTEGGTIMLADSQVQ